MNAVRLIVLWATGLLASGVFSASIGYLVGRVLLNSSVKYQLCVSEAVKAEINSYTIDALCNPHTGPEAAWTGFIIGICVFACVRLWLTQSRQAR